MHFECDKKCLYVKAILKCFYNGNESGCNGNTIIWTERQVSG